MSFAELYHYYNVEQSDPRMNHWFLINNPFHLFLILFGYAYFVLKCGPKFMEKKQPYSLKTFIYFYNIFQIVVNVIIVYGFLTVGRSIGELSLGCEPLRQGTKPEDLMFLRVCYLTLSVKVIDLIETMVFVFRKKNNQITVLHVYHHISTVVVTYVCVKYFAGGMTAMQMIVNGTVHVIMYSYYLLASLGPVGQRIVRPIKPYITRIQIAQFIFLVAHQSQAFLPSCPFPKKAPAMIVGNLLLNLVLFLNFYRQNYRKNHVKSS